MKTRALFCDDFDFLTTDNLCNNSKVQAQKQMADAELQRAAQLKRNASVEHQQAHVEHV